MAAELHDLAQDSTTFSYRALFDLAGFPRLAIGTLLARTANSLWGLTLVLFVLQRYHSPILAGLATFCGIVPGVIFSPVAGALLDRYRRLRMILVDYTVAAATMVTIATLALTGHLPPPLLLGIIAVSSLTGPLSASGTRTLFPLVVPRRLWDRANAIDSGTQAIAMVVGPALAGFGVALVGGEGTFLFTAALFVASGAVLLGMQDPAAPGQAVASAAKRESLLRSSWQALGYVLRNPTLRGVILTLWMSNIPLGILSVALPVLILHTLHLSTSIVGGLYTIAGITTVISGTVIGRFTSEGRERGMIALGLAISGLACLLIFLQSPLTLILGMALYGLASGPINIGLFALRQRRTDPRWFGRVFAVSMSLNYAGTPIGSALAGPLAAQSVLLALGVATGIALLGTGVPFLTIPRGE